MTAEIKDYVVIFEHTENNSSAYSPDVPGCMATGKTREEAVLESLNNQEAINPKRESGVRVPPVTHDPPPMTQYD